MMEKHSRIRTLKSFTLIEIMIVVAIMITITAIAIPNIRRQRHNADENRVIMMMLAIITAELDYRTSNDTYCSFKEDDTAVPGEGLLDSDPPYLTIPGYDSSETGLLTTVNYSNYSIMIGNTLPPPDANGFTMMASSTLYPNSARRFWATQEGTIYYCEGVCTPSPSIAGIPLEF